MIRVFNNTPPPAGTGEDLEGNQVMTESTAEEEGNSPDVFTEVQTRLSTANNNNDGD